MTRAFAMIMAGGSSESLSVLTEVRAEPAVPFGGKFRLVDFPLSTIEEILEAQKTDSFCQTVLARQSKRIDSAFFEGPDGLLRRRHPREPDIEQVVLPETLRPRVLQLAHHAKLAGHPGQMRMYSPGLFTLYFRLPFPPFHSTVHLSISQLICGNTGSGCAP